jgi:uncharacterized tellurite resistance protein B-like protein
MANIRYESVYPLIARVERERGTIRVAFRCPISGETVDASAPIPQTEELIPSTPSAAWRLRGAVAGAARRAMASGGPSLDTAAPEQPPAITDERIQLAIVDAFESVASYFAWDRDHARYVSATAAGEIATEFARQLEAAPVKTAADRRALARLLCEIACADGKLAAKERAFLAGFAGDDEVGAVDELVQLAIHTPLSAAELGATEVGASRDTLLMLAWALAYTDEDLADAERTRLHAVAAGLGIDAQRAAELQRFAQLWLVDNALVRAYPGGARSPAAHAWVAELARRIALPAAELHRADARFRRRNGIE